jgi:hypothetical protein
MFEIREAKRSDEMNKLTIKADLLRLTGNVPTLQLAEIHNMRRMARGNGAIYPLRSQLDTELVPLVPLSLNDKVISILISKGITQSLINNVNAMSKKIEKGDVSNGTKS